MEFDAKQIRTAREKAGLTQAELARRLGVKRQSIQQIESGFHTPNMKTVLKIWGALGVKDPRPFFVR